MCNGDELKALNENNTWTLVPLPPGERAIGCRWVFAVKTDHNGEVQRYKARLVAKGYSQRENVDFFETFAPVVRYESIRILLSIAPSENLEISKFDVKTAFLNGDLEEVIYMQQPRGFVDKQQPNSVFKLFRSLYGLKQGSRCWNIIFVKFMENYNFKSIDSDQCIFIGSIKGFKVILGLYVDDGLLLSKSQAAIDELLKLLKKDFQITVEKPD